MMKKFLFTTVMTVLAAASLQGRTINIHGTVTIQGTNEPAAGVTIFNAASNKLLGVTGEEGRYNITADSEWELIFSSMSCDEHREQINGRLEINVGLMPQANELEEIVVMAKAGKPTLVTEPTDLDLDGNILRLKTKVKIPPKLFSSNVRMIIQPAIYNVTRKHVSYLNPVVYDGWRYAVTQERMYDWDAAKDTLNAYQQVKHTSRKAENTVYLIDSLFVENPKDDFMCCVLSSLENYNRIIYADTFEIARGTVNPLRFLEYSLDPMTMNEEKFLPTPEVELRDANGEMHLLFPVGKSNLDLALGNNGAEMESLLGEFRTIENDPDMALKSFAIYGSASPEGRYESNKNLAQARMRSAMETVLQNIDPSLKRNADISSEASVASWEEVVTMLRADGADDEADKVQSVIDRYANVDNRSVAMTRLPFYRSLLVEKYLPRLRRVNYRIVTSRYRPLTDEEIAELYLSNPSGLSKYQFYRYYSTLEGEAREKALRQAVKSHPDFVVAATDLSEIMLARQENPMEVLEPFFSDPKKWNKLPISTRYNMGVACLDSMRYTLADSILSTIPDSPETHKAKIYCTALNGRYREVLQEINQDSPLNEVLLLLALKDNAHAWERAKTLGDSAVEEYVKAVAANRLDNYMEAIVHLENALSLDPSLKEVAKVDGDIVDLLDEEDLNDTNE